MHLEESLNGRGRPSGRYPVVLERNWKAYNAGDVAGFDLAVAKKLCEAGIARPYVAKKDKPKAKLPTKKEQRAAAKAKALREENIKAQKKTIAKAKAAREAAEAAKEPTEEQEETEPAGPPGPGPSRL